MATATSAIYYLESLGLTDVILPFLLIFVVVFAILQKSKLFGAESKKYNIIVALAIALLVIVPHVTGTYPPGVDAVQIINDAIPAVSVIAIAIIMFLILAGIFIEPKQGGWMSGITLLISLIAVVWIFGKAAGWWYTMPGWMSDPDLQALVVIILVFGIIIYFVTSEGKGSNPGSGLVDWLKSIGKDA